ncbi:MAG: TIGR03118 family protein [Isosphaeraceae bacterium]
MLFRRTAVAPCLGLVLLMVPALAQAQYHLTNLVSNQVDSHAPTIDPLLANPWGLARSAGSPWWISDNDTGWSTLYNAAGTQEALKVVIPTAGNGPVEPTGLNGPGTPTGIVFNGSKTDFQVSGVSSSFIFATLDGTISAWPGLNKNLATLVADESASKASYTGLAITSKTSGNFLYAADNTNNKIDMFDGNFNLVGSFGDPSIPSTFSVFGVQDINGLVYVTYAVPNVGAGGYVDLFKEDGTFVKTLVSSAGALDAPWGLAVVPSAGWGSLSPGTLLVGNFGVSAGVSSINAYDPMVGTWLGQLVDSAGSPLQIDGLWALEFGVDTDAGESSQQLYFTAGPAGQSHGLLGYFAVSP